MSRAERNKILAKARNRCQRCGASGGSRGAKDQHGVWHYEFAVLSLKPETQAELFGKSVPDIYDVRLGVAGGAVVCQKCRTLRRV